MMGSTSGLGPNAPESDAATNQSVIRVEKQEFDAYNARFSVDVSIQNKASAPFDYPSFLEVAAARSDCGRIGYLNSYGASSQGHSMFPVPARPDRRQLLPEERSLPVHLEISVSGCETGTSDLVGAARSQALASRPLFPLALRFRVFSMTRDASISLKGKSAALQ